MDRRNFSKLALAIIASPVAFVERLAAMPHKQEKYVHPVFGEYMGHEIVPVTPSHHHRLNWPFRSVGDHAKYLMSRVDNMAIYYQNGWQLYYMLDPDEQTKNIILKMSPQEIFAHADPTTLKSELVFGEKRYIWATSYNSVHFLRDNSIQK